MFCREQVGSLDSWLDRFAAAGADLVVIGNGTVEQARAFRDARHVRARLLVDPKLRAYRAAGLRRSVLGTMNLAVLVNAKRALAAGNTQGMTHGDALQLGGAFVVGPGGKLAFEHRSEVAGDHPDPAALLGAVRELGLAGHTSG